MAVEVKANQFDFFLIADGGGFNQVDAIIVDGAEDNGGGVALVFVTPEEELGVFLACSAFGELKAEVVLLSLDEGGDGREDFQEMVVRDFFTGIRLKGFKELVGGEGGNARGDAAGSAGEMPGGGQIFFGVGERGLDLEPALVAGGAPVAEVLAIDGRAGELVGEDFLDGGESIEPGEDEGSGLAVAEAAVKLFADVVGESGDFADEGALFHTNAVESWVS